MLAVPDFDSIRSFVNKYERSTCECISLYTKSKQGAVTTVGQRSRNSSQKTQKYL